MPLLLWPWPEHWCPLPSRHRPRKTNSCRLSSRRSRLTVQNPLALKILPTLQNRDSRNTQKTIQMTMEGRYHLRRNARDMFRKRVSSIVESLDYVVSIEMVTAKVTVLNSNGNSNSITYSIGGCIDPTPDHSTCRRTMRSLQSQSRRWGCGPGTCRASDWCE